MKSLRKFFHDIRKIIFYSWGFYFLSGLFFIHRIILISGIFLLHLCFYFSYPLFSYQKNNFNKSGNSETLRETLNNIMTSVFGKQSDTKNFIFINIFSMFLQILIQYWQVMMTYSLEFLDKNILLGVVFSKF